MRVLRARENTGMAGEADLGPELRKDEDEEFEKLIPEHTDSERRELERSVLSEGLREPLVAWRPPGEEDDPPILIDGHVRHEICRKRGVDYEVRELEFASREEAKAWVLVTHLGRRNLTPAGRCEVAIHIERMLEPLARERQREAGRTHGRGHKSSETAGEKLVPELVEAISWTHASTAKEGRARVQAAKAVGVGAESLRKYKAVMDAKETETRPEVRKVAEEQYRRMQGTTPRATINRAHAIWNAEKEAADARDDFTEATDTATEPGGWAYYPEDDDRPAAGSDDGNCSEDSAEQPAQDGSGAEPEDAEEGSGAASRNNGASKWTVRNPRWRHSEFQNAIDTLPNNSVELLLTDPPYGLGRGDIPGDDDIDFAAGLLGDLLDKIKPKLMKDAHVVVFTAEMDSLKAWMRATMESHGYLHVDDRPLIWSKTDLSGGVQGHPRRKDQLAGGLLPSYEMALHGMAGEPGLVWEGQPNNFVVPQGIGRDYYQHPTTKPVPMLQRLIQTMVTDEKAIVADPFGGSATTLEAAMRAGRHSWGTERYRKYYEAGMARITDVRNELEEALQPALFEMVLPPSATSASGFAMARSGAFTPAEPSWSLPFPATLWGFGEMPAPVKWEALFRYEEVWVEYSDIYFDYPPGEPESTRAGWYVFIGLEASDGGAIQPEVLGPFSEELEAERALDEYARPWDKSGGVYLAEP